MVACKEQTRIFWICIIIAFIFIVFGCISFLQKILDAEIAFLFALWFLNMVLLVILTYKAVLLFPYCQVIIFILFVIALLFSTVWVLQFDENLIYANMSIVITLIAILGLIHFSQVCLLPLGILYVMVWLFIFFYVNHIHDIQHFNLN